MIATRADVVRGGRGVATVAAAFAVGVLLAAVGARFGPLAMLAPGVAVVFAAAAVGRPALALLPVVAVLPLATMEIPGPLRTVDVAVVAAAAAIVTARLNAGAGLLAWSPPLWWAGGLLLVVVAVTPAAIDPSLAITQAVTLGLGVLLAAAALAAVRSFAEMRLILGATVAVGAASCALALGDVSSLRAEAGGAVVANRIEGVLGGPNHLGGFAAMVALLAAALAVGGRTRRVRILAAGAVVPAVAALLFSLSRGAWMGAATGGVALAVLLPESRRYALAGGSALVVVALAFGALQPDAVQVEVVQARLSTVVSGDVGPYDDRPAIWAEGRRHVMEKPLTGQGPGNFPVASARWHSDVRAGVSHAHNTILTVAAEAGLVAAALVVIFTVAIARTAWRAAQRARGFANRAAVAGCAAALATLIGHGVVDYTLRSPVLRVLPWLLVGLVLAADRCSNDAPVRH